MHSHSYTYGGSDSNFYIQHRDWRFAEDISFFTHHNYTDQWIKSFLWKCCRLLLLKKCFYNLRLTCSTFFITILWPSLYFDPCTWYRHPTQRLDVTAVYFRWTAIRHVHRVVNFGIKSKILWTQLKLVWTKWWYASYSRQHM